MLGAATITPEELELELRWLDAELKGKPYGVNVLMAASFVEGTPDELEAMIPEVHRRFVAQLEERFAIPPLPENAAPPTGIFGSIEFRGMPDVGLRGARSGVRARRGRDRVRARARAGGGDGACPRAWDARRRHGRRRASCQEARRGRAQTSWSPPATRAPATTATSRRWSSCPRSSTPWLRSPCWRPAASRTAARSPRRWHSAPRASGPVLSGWRARKASSCPSRSSGC